MNEQAAHLVDRVLPRAPYGHWVLTLPWELARAVAFDARLATAVFGLFADELACWYRANARVQRIEDGQTGCVLEIQRFADGARLWPHAHALTPEGVFGQGTSRCATSTGCALPCRSRPGSPDELEHLDRAGFFEAFVPLVIGAINFPVYLGEGRERWAINRRSLWLVSARTPSGSSCSWSPWYWPTSPSP